jgi:2'-5' RNA ligase
MLCTAGCGRTLNQFALVAYIQGQLADFLDSLRLELTPGCNPRAHVTVLPPRPLDKGADLRETIDRLGEESRVAPPVKVTLGDIEIFGASNVIYLSLASGERELHALHENLNSGQLEYDGPYPYHPHVTIAQGIDGLEMGPEQVAELARSARERWAQYDGPRVFTVDCLSFVQNVAPGTWVDVAKLPMATPVGVSL